MQASCSLVFRRFLCCANGSVAASPPPIHKKKNLVFMGSPKVCVSVLERLFSASEAPDSTFQIECNQVSHGRTKEIEVDAHNADVYIRSHKSYL